MNDNDKSWAKFLHPETLRSNLLSISLFITTYEMFKARVIDKPKQFFWDGFDENGPTTSKKYDIDVLSRNKNKLYASLLWLKDMEALDQNDIDTFDSIRKHRNEVVHEPLVFLSIHERELDISKFQALIKIFRKIEVWWFINFEASIDPDMVPDGADIESVVPGQILILQLILDIAFGDEPEEGYYYNSFMKLKT